MNCRDGGYGFGMRIFYRLLVGAVIVVVGWMAIGLAVYAWTARTPNYDGLAEDISDLPGVVEATSTVIAEDTELWTSIVRVVVADDIDEDRLAAVIEEYEGDNASQESVRLAITVEGEPESNEYGDSEGSALVTRGEAATFAEVRATGFLHARDLVEGDVRLEEDALVMGTDAELDEAIREIAADPYLSALRFITVHGPIGERAGTFQGPTPIEADALDALEATSSVMREMSPKVAATLSFSSGYVSPYGPEGRQVRLQLDDSVKVAKHRHEVEATVRELVAVGFEKGERGKFGLDRGPLTRLAEVTFDDHLIDGSRSNSVRWRRFVEGAVRQQIAHV